MDSILSVRISEDLKNKFIKLAEEEGINNKEFMDLIIKSYELNKTVTGNAGIKNDIDELTAIIKRIMDIYMNMVEKNNVKLTESTNIFKTELQKEEAVKEKLMAEIEKHKSIADEYKKEIEELKAETAKKEVAQAEVLEKMAEMKEVSEFFKGRVKELEDYKKDADAKISNVSGLEEENKRLNTAISNYINDIEGYKAQIKKLSDELQSSKEQYDEKLNAHIDEMERKNKLIIDELSLKYKQESFQKEEAHSKELWSIRNSYEERIEKLMADKELLLNKLEENNSK